MPRTTIDIDPTVLQDLKRRQKREKKSLGRLVSELLAQAMTREHSRLEPLRWRKRSMRARVDLEDKEAVRRALDEG